ncbi:hypothetical protein ACLB2K_021137 [Fragaria x ananassa]
MATLVDFQGPYNDTTILWRWHDAALDGGATRQEAINGAFCGFERRCKSGELAFYCSNGAQMATLVDFQGPYNDATILWRWHDAALDGGATRQEAINGAFCGFERRCKSGELAFYCSVQFTLIFFSERI